MTETQTQDLAALASWSTRLLLMLERDDLSADELAELRPSTRITPAVDGRGPIDLFDARRDLRLSVERISTAAVKLDGEAAQWFVQRELPVTLCRFNALHELLRSLR